MASSLAKTRHVTIAAALAAMLGLPSYGSAAAPAPDASYVTNGPVHAIADAGSRTYVGGSFTRVGPRTGAGAVLSASGMAQGFPEVAGGEVRAVIPDRRGGWYIGGSFTSVGGQVRLGLAHVVPSTDGWTVDPAFAPSVLGTTRQPGTVNALVLAAAPASDAGTLYVGGRFSQIGGSTLHPRVNLAALRASNHAELADRVPTDQPTPLLNTRTECGQVPSCSPAVNALALTYLPLAVDGEVSPRPQPLLMVGGGFDAIGSSETLPTGFKGLAAVWGEGAVSAAGSPITGVVLDTGSAPWAPTLGVGASASPIDFSVDSLAMPASPPSPPSTTVPVYVGGMRRAIDGSPLTPMVLAYRVTVASAGRTVAEPSRLYGGWGAPPAASIDVEQCSGCSVRSVVLDGTKLYFGGDFTTVGGAQAGYVGQANAIANVDSHASGANPPAAAPFGPGVDGPVWSLAKRSGSPAGLYVGGEFSARIAALDVTGVHLSPGTTPAWNGPSPSDRVRAVAVDHPGAAPSAIYAGGDFGAVDSVPRRNLAAFDEVGSLLSWAPEVEGPAAVVHAVAASDSTVYVGGLFDRVAGLAREGLAAIDGAGNGVSSFDPALTRDGARPDVLSLALQGSTLYVGGAFDMVGGHDRRNLAAVDSATGVASAWAPEAAGGVVHDVLPACGAVYVGGGFDEIGGRARDHLASVDPISGEPTSWNPAPNGAVLALARSGGTIYAGGNFVTVAGELRQRVAGFDAGHGSLTDFDPAADAAVRALGASDTAVYLGGNFSRLGGEARARLAAANPVTGTPTAWDPSPDDAVSSLALGDGDLTTGGLFRAVGVSSSVGLARFTSGIGSPFVPSSCTARTRTEGSPTVAADPPAAGTVVGETRGIADAALKISRLTIAPLRVVLGRSTLRIRFTTSRAGPVELRFARRLRTPCRGRSRRSRVCHRYARFAMLKGRATRGVNRLSFPRQRIGRRRLIAGRYRLTVVGRPGTRAGTAVSAMFRVVRPGPRNRPRTRRR